MKNEVGAARLTHRLSGALEQSDKRLRRKIKSAFQKGGGRSAKRNPTTEARRKAPARPVARFNRRGKGIASPALKKRPGGFIRSVDGIARKYRALIGRPRTYGPRSTRRARQPVRKPTMRTPQAIATEAQTLAATSAKWSVPIPADQLAALTIEFMASMADGFADAVAEAVAAAPKA